MPTAFLARALQLPHMRVIPHGVEVRDSFRRSADTSGTPTIVFQGRLVSTKGIRVLLEAARTLRSQNRSFELVIVGDGPERTKLQELAQQMDLASCIRITGCLAVTEMESILAAARAIVLPSLGAKYLA